MTNIHPTAIIEKGAEVSGADIGPYCHVGPQVKLAKGVKLHSHVVVGGDTTIGENTEIFPFASIGLKPQDLKFKNEPSKLVIGKNNVIREHVTMNPGTEGGGLLTQVGDNCLFMMSTHVAHDCIVGNHVILANNATLAGHVHVGDYAVIGGLSAIHQFVRIGHHAMIGGMSGIESDIIPYGQASGERASLVGLNLIGLKRRGFEREEINALRTAYRLLFSPEGTLAERVSDAGERFNNNPLVMEILAFMRENGSRALCLPRDADKAA
ncbi:MAG: acyl-ACP--UDP-N-acetylglucosamine O-acyltransferase [Proteobacteria bacterium]|nr:acyl-ACP--UDP-N-acetylglucosamine O-acyltransferase [Pseudomonadota bacterium]